MHFCTEWVWKNIQELRVRRIQVFSDSKYVYDGYRWVRRWCQNDYRNSDGRPIRNDDLWKGLMRLKRKLASRVRIELRLLEGKSTPITKAVDKDAKAGVAPLASPPLPK
jgi:ribonuclease HI